MKAKWEQDLIIGLKCTEAPTFVSMSNEEVWKAVEVIHSALERLRIEQERRMFGRTL